MDITGIITTGITIMTTTGTTIGITTGIISGTTVTGKTIGKITMQMPIGIEIIRRTGVILVEDRQEVILKDGEDGWEVMAGEDGVR